MDPTIAIALSAGLAIVVVAIIFAVSRRRDSNALPPMRKQESETRHRARARSVQRSTRRAQLVRSTNHDADGSMLVHGMMLHSLHSDREHTKHHHESAAALHHAPRHHESAPAPHHAPSHHETGGCDFTSNDNTGSDSGGMSDGGGGGDCGGGGGGD